MKKIKKCTFFESTEPLQEVLRKSHSVSIGYYFVIWEKSKSGTCTPCSEINPYLANSNGQGVISPMYRWETKGKGAQWTLQGHLRHLCQLPNSFFAQVPCLSHNTRLPSQEITSAASCGFSRSREVGFKFYKSLRSPASLLGEVTTLSFRNKPPCRALRCEQDQPLPHPPSHPKEGT